MLGMDTKPHTRAGFAVLLAFSCRIAVSMFALVAVLPLAASGYADTGQLWDPQRYIDIDEIKLDMEAYCLTDYGQGGIEKFALKIVDVVHNMDPGHDAILVMGLDERFRHTGPVGGCSGSPVYIDGRLAGALAFGWSYPKDPLYGVTPIKEMLQVGRTNGTLASSGANHQTACAIDFSEPIDLVEAGRYFSTRRLLASPSSSGASVLPCPLLISGLPTEASQQIASQFEAMGFMAVPGLSGGATAQTGEDLPELKPGGTVTVPLVAGDISMNVLGTVTEVRGDRIFAFGHSFLGYGPINLPMAGGKVHTVVSSVMRSFKLGTAGPIIGALTTDEATAVAGTIGAKPPMIPLSIRVERYNDTQPRVYNCQVAHHDTLTSSLMFQAISGAVLQQGPFPPDHTLDYTVSIELEDGQAIRFNNSSTNLSLLEVGSEIVGALGLLMNNPYAPAKIKSLDFTVQAKAKNSAGHLWSIDVSNAKCKPGDTIGIDVVIESFLSAKRRFQTSITVPADIAPGKYQLMVCGAQEYERYLTKAMPYRFVATNYQTLVDALNMALSVDRTKLYSVLTLPPNGITLDKAELPHLPGTKAIILQSDTRAMRVRPHPHWVEQAVEADAVIMGKEIVNIVVEK